MGLKVTLLGYVDNVEKIIAACTKSAQSEFSSEELFNKLNREEARKFIGRTFSRGHEGISEFSYFIFSINGISRVLTHQLVRHRIASYLQMSSRGRNLTNSNFIIPPEIQQNSKALEIFNETIGIFRKKYVELTSLGIKFEDARYILPSSIETHISMAMNARSLNHLFGLRLCTRAQWEIRTLIKQIRDIVKKIAPSIFWSEQRPCVVKGLCPEGKNSCEYWKTEKYDLERLKYIKGYPNE